MKQVAALVSAYYAERYITRRIENLLEQHIPLEIAVVARCDSAEAKVAEKYGVILIQTYDIPTIYRAWNLAILDTTAKYLTSANCDDLFYPGGLEAMVEELDNHPEVAIVYGDVDRFDERTGQCQRWIRPDGDINLLLQRCLPGAMPMWRRSLHDKYGLFDSRYHVAGDYEFWLRVVSRGERMRHVDYLIGQYTWRPDSAEHRDIDLARAETRQVREVYHAARQ